MIPSGASSQQHQHQPRSTEGAANGASRGSWALASGARVERELLAAWLLLLVGQRPSYGYELCRQLAHHGFVVDASVMYRTLRRLEARGLVRSHWMKSTLGPRRRSYHLTAAGQDKLDELAASIAVERDIRQGFLGVHGASTREGHARR